MGLFFELRDLLSQLARSDFTRAQLLNLLVHRFEFVLERRVMLVHGIQRCKEIDHDEK